MVHKKDAEDTALGKEDPASSDAVGAAEKLSDEALEPAEPSRLKLEQSGLPVQFGDMELVNSSGDQRLALNSTAQTGEPITAGLSRAAEITDTTAKVADFFYTILGAGSDKTARNDDAGVPKKQADGSLVTRFRDGTSRTEWQDGTVRTQYKDGHFVLHKPEAQGGYREEHGGNPRAEDNFVLVKTKDGRYYRTESMSEQPQKWDVTPLGTYLDMLGHKELDKLVEEKIKDPERLAKFRADMARFEQRMSTQDLGSIGVSFTYEHIERLLKAQGNEPLTEQERLKLAEELMSQAATPSSVDQGKAGSASGLALERKTYADSPSEAARLVVDIALTGEYETRDGSVIRLSRDKLTPDEEANARPRKPGMRSYASQIFQSAPAAKALE